MDMRELKGLELAARSRIAFHLGFWLVPSQSSGATYRVTIGADPTCNCPDFELRRQPCKHIVAARLVAEREADEPAGVVVDEVPKRPTYRQDWAKYNVAQMTEKNRFLEMLSELVRGIEEPPQPRTGRRRHLMRDQIFAAALLVATLSRRGKAWNRRPAPGNRDRGVSHSPAGHAFRTSQQRQKPLL